MDIEEIPPPTYTQYIEDLLKRYEAQPSRELLREIQRIRHIHKNTAHTKNKTI